VRRLRALVLLTVLPLGAAVGVAVAGEDPPTDQQCREQWADLGQLHGENGNPGGPAAELRHRWDALDREADRYAAEATAADCGATIDDFAASWDALEGFQYDVYAVDAASDLRAAESGRRHYLSMHSAMTPELRRAFRVIRHHTPGAIRDLEPALAGAGDVDVEDPAAIRAFMRQVRDVKRASSHIQKMRHSYRVIGNAELDEE
jgi:hypothetical protein